MQVVIGALIFHKNFISPSHTCCPYEEPRVSESTTDFCRSAMILILNYLWLARANQSVERKWLIRHHTIIDLSSVVSVNLPNLRWRMSFIWYPGNSRGILSDYGRAPSSWGSLCGKCVSRSTSATLLVASCGISPCRRRSRGLAGRSASQRALFWIS